MFIFSGFQDRKSKIKVLVGLTKVSGRSSPLGLQVIAFLLCSHGFCVCKKREQALWPILQGHESYEVMTPFFLFFPFLHIIAKSEAQFPSGSLPVCLRMCPRGGEADTLKLHQVRKI